MADDAPEDGGAPKRVLKTVVFFGSSRDAPAFWGGDARLGDRVLAWATSVLAARSAPCGSETVTHDVLKKLALVGKDLGEYSLETVEMFYEDAREAGYKL